MDYRKKTWTMLALLVLLVGACDSAGDDEDVGVLMPLEVGNTWSYAVEGSDEPVMTLEARDDVERGDQRYTIVVEVGSEDEGVQTAVRQSGDGVYFAEYHPDTGELDADDLHFRYPVDDGETYTFQGTDVEVQRQTVDVPAGTYDAYAYNVSDDVEGERSFVFAPDIGMVVIEVGGEALELVSADV